VGGAGRCKWNEGQDWHAPRRFRTDYETLLGLVPTQGQQDLLTLGDSSHGGFPEELPIRLKENRYKKVLRARHSLKNQKGINFEVMTWPAIFVFQRELLLHWNWNTWAAATMPLCYCATTAQNLAIAMRSCLY